MLKRTHVGGLLLLVACAAGVPACIFETGKYEGGGRSGTGAKPPDTNATSTSTTTSSSASSGGTDSGTTTDTGTTLPDTGTGG